MNKEIQEFQESFFFGLSMRQCFFSVLAIAAAVGVYLGTKDTCGTEIAGWLSVFAAAPFAGCGFFRYHQMTLEKFVWVWLKSEILCPKKLVFQSENLYLKSTIQRYASQYGISEYVPSIQAIMMQESGGRGTDPMQASECPYNTRYPNSPGAIQDPEYSIQVGVQYYADCVRQAGCESPLDISRLQLSWQGYNYGNGYIGWALEHHGGYSLENALQFSQEKAAELGWPRYGDPQYVPHVQRYYSGGGILGGIFGNGQIVQVAKQEVGSSNGEKYWRWYGFDSYVEWCACFVSWCGEQAGLIESGAMPKFSLCENGIDWFKSHGKWQETGGIPSAGSLVFFDWNGDGISDHVGIVEKYEGGIIYTVEGNTGTNIGGNNVRGVWKHSYSVGSATILGYGII